MAQQRTAWHVGFFRLIEQRRPKCFEVTSEYPFGTLPQRADLLLVRRLDLPADDASARVLRRLWPEVRREGIVEYKSPASPYAHRDLLVLLGCQHFSASADRLPEHFDLLLALAVSHMTPAPRSRKTSIPLDDAAEPRLEGTLVGSEGRFRWGLSSSTGCPRRSATGWSGSLGHDA